MPGNAVDRPDSPYRGIPPSLFAMADKKAPPAECFARGTFDKEGAFVFVI